MEADLQERKSRDNPFASFTIIKVRKKKRRHLGAGGKKQISGIFLKMGLFWMVYWLFGWPIGLAYWGKR